MNEFKIGTYIKKQREALGMSQEELCEGCCSVSNLSRIENNLQAPSRSLTKKLLERLGLPQDTFIAFWGQQDITVGALVRDIQNDMIRCHRMPKEEQPQAIERIWEKLTELENIITPDARSAQQFLLAQKALLGRPAKPYSIEEKLAMQLDAIRLTCPKFDPEDFLHGHYNMDETRLINQIANSYLAAGQTKKAVDIYRQLLRYVEKNDSELVGYANHYCMIAHNFAIALERENLYSEAIKVAEQGRRNCIYYGKYQFLPGFLAIQAKSYCCLQKEEGRKLYFQAYYIYQAFEDEANVKNTRQEIKTYLGIEMPE